MQDTLILPDIDPAIPMSRVAPDTVTPAENRVALPSLVARRILLPFDLSRPSICALRVATDFAERAGASLYLLHVVKPAEETLAEAKFGRADDNMAETAERLLKHWVKRVVQGRVRTFVSIRIGEPVDTIVARAVATRADLIVMTSRSCSGLKNELQRSSAERVSRLAPCPVLTVPQKCVDELAYSAAAPWVQPWETVLMPVDFSSAAEHGLRFAAGIAARNGARLLLAHGAGTDDLDEYDQHFRLRSWATERLNEPVSCQTAVWPGGNSLYAILSEAVRSEANLIVLPTQAQSWAQRLRAGSITDGVLRQAPCPVLSINTHSNYTED